MIYLDHNATAPLRPSALKSMNDVARLVGNPSAAHRAGSVVRTHLNAARKTIADHFNVSIHQVIFTSGATEANNFALKGFQGDVIINYGEHDCVFKARKDAYICPINSDGVIKLDKLDEIIAQIRSQSDKPILVSVMAANNETGVIQPLAEMLALLRKYKNVYSHCDGVQMLGKRNEWTALDLDVITISSHKIGGPTGIGAIIFKRDVPILPLLVGGGQERFHRAGTQNTVGAAGFAQALKECAQDDWQNIKNLRDYMEQTIITAAPQVDIIGQKSDRLANTSCITMPGVKNTAQQIYFDLNNIMISTGPACSSGTVKPSRILINMGMDEVAASQAIRVSLGWYTTMQDIESFINYWISFYKQSNHQQMSTQIGAQ